MAKYRLVTSLLITTLVFTVLTITNSQNISQIFAAKSGSGLKQIPSEPTDFPNDNSSAIKVDVTTAKKDIIGAYHVKGEIKNLGQDSLNYVQVIAHFYDSANQTVGVTSCCYANPTDIEPGHTATFDSFATKDDMSGTPKSYRLSFEWD